MRCAATQLPRANTSVEILVSAGRQHVNSLHAAFAQKNMAPSSAPLVYFIRDHQVSHL